MEIERAWREAIDNLKGSVAESDLACWVAAIAPREITAGVFHATVPSVLHLERVRTSVEPAITEALSGVLGTSIVLALSVDRGRIADARREEVAPEPSAFVSAYTFEHFVVGPSNEVAFHAAQEVAAEPGRRFNPLFLYGGVGLGKTHLVTAIATVLAGNGRKGRTLMLSAEAFGNEAIRAFRGQGVDAFRGRFRRCETLLVDDVQFFAGKERMQEEFFHTFNALFEAGKQIIVASDRPPCSIPNLEGRLRSRFESGLLADIRPPDFSLRLSILAQKAKWLGLDLPGEVAEWVAEKIVSSVRELEGALARLRAVVQLRRRPIDLASAQEALRPLLRAPARRSLEQVQQVVAERFEVRTEDLVARQRLTRLRLPRQVAMYLARTGTGATFSEIAQGFGGRDHTTVMHAVRSVEARRSREPEFAALLAGLAERLQSA